MVAGCACTLLCLPGSATRSSIYFDNDFADANSYYFTNSGLLDLQNSLLLQIYTLNCIGLLDLYCSYSYVLYSEAESDKRCESEHPSLPQGRRKHASYLEPGAQASLRLSTLW